MQGAPPDQAFYRVGASRNDAASGKQQQAHGNNPFAAPVIAGNAPWQLQGGLRQPVNAHGRTHGGGAGMAGVRVAPPGAAGQVVRRLQREDGHDQKQPQHAQGKNQSQTDAGTALGRQHGLCGRRSGWKIHVPCAASCAACRSERGTSRRTLC